MKSMQKMSQLKAPVVSILEATPETYLIRLEAPEIAAEARPGQFVMVRCGPDAFLPRPFSLHRTGDGQISILFKVVGKGTGWLARRKQGESLDIFGPLGNGFTVNPQYRNLLLVAGGIGIAPLCFLAETAAGAGKKVTLLNGALSRVHLLPVTPAQRLFDGGMQPADFNVVYATDDGSEGFKGEVTRLIPHYLENTDQVFACGPMAMYRSMARMPELQGKDVQLSLEIMMGCGMGVCYGCTIKTKSGLKQVCQDGPVLRMEELQL